MDFFTTLILYNLNPFTNLVQLFDHCFLMSTHTKVKTSFILAHVHSNPKPYKHS